MTTPGLTSDSTIEIISAYTATNQTIAAVASAPGWHVVGLFFLPVNATCRLEALGGVSDDSLVMTVRLFDLTAVAAVSGSEATIDKIADERETSGVITLAGGRNYQIQAQVLGGAGADLYGSLKGATLIN